MDQHDGDKPGDRRRVWFADVGGRRGSIPPGSPADVPAGGIRGRLVVLRSASVRGDVLGREPDVERARGGAYGSSHYDLPGVLRWFTANIGMHHIHHLSSRIPFYRLPEVLRDHPELRAVGRLTFFQSLKCVRLALWDDERRRLISFKEIRAEKSAGSRD